jgi:hypothetical protein
MHPKPGHPELREPSEATDPGIFHSQATILKLWAPELLAPPGTQLDTSLGHLEAPEAQKTTRRDREMSQTGNRHPGIVESSQATVPELLGPPGTQLDLSLGDLDTPEAQETTRLDRKMPQSRNRHPGIFQSSQATVLELWASPELLGPPWTELHMSSSLDTSGSP